MSVSGPSVLIGFAIIFLLVTGASASDNETADSAAAIIPFLNQKVSGYYAEKGIPDKFSLEDYKRALENTCYASPVCRQEAEEIFNEYGIEVEKISANIFRVLYCDPDKTAKVMEDYSCNATCVEIKTYQLEELEPCAFAEVPQAVIKQNCKRGAVCD